MTQTHEDPEMQRLRQIRVQLHEERQKTTKEEWKQRLQRTTEKAITEISSLRKVSEAKR